MSSEPSDLAALAKLWQAVPYVEVVGVQAQLLVASLPELEPSTNAFNAVLTTTAQSFLGAIGRPEPDPCIALGRAITWLGDLGLLEDLHLDFVERLPDAQTKIITALRDGCIGQIQSDYRQHFLHRHCAHWQTKTALVSQWLSRAKNDRRQPWELVDNIDRILDKVGAGKRLATHLRTSGRFARETQRAEMPLGC